MSEFQRHALGARIIEPDAVEVIHDAAMDMTRNHLIDVVKRLAMSHERIRAELSGAEIVIVDTGVVVNRMESALMKIATDRDLFNGPSLDYMQGYRNGQEYLARIARTALSNEAGDGDV